MSWFVSLDTFIIQFIILLLILWVLKKFIFVPYLEYLDEWEEKQKKLEEDYKHIDDLVNKAKEKKKSILDEARKKAEREHELARLKVEAEAQTDTLASLKEALSNATKLGKK